MILRRLGSFAGARAGGVAVPTRLAVDFAVGVMRSATASFFNLRVGHASVREIHHLAQKGEPLPSVLEGVAALV